MYEIIHLEREEMDRISELPDFIAHHILSFINTPADLIRMSVLSKTWFHLTASFPILVFDYHNFPSGRLSFYKYIQYTTSRFCNHNLTAHKFNLRTVVRKRKELDIVDRCLQLVLENGVRELGIGITQRWRHARAPRPQYRLPNILLSASVLSSLSIRGYNLPSSLTADAFVFKSLTKLKLEYHSIDDELISYLTTGCPVLQVLKIKDCRGFKRFCVYGHQNLERVVIHYNTDAPLEVIDIDAPNLCDISISDRAHRGAPQMNLASCQKLTTVTYSGDLVPNSNGCTDFLSNFPFVENLVLTTTYECDSLMFSSRSLRTLLLHSNCDLEDIEFNTPNLVLFIQTRSDRMLWPMVIDKHWPLLSDSARLKSSVRCFPYGGIDALWFKKLRLLFAKRRSIKVLNMYINAKYSRTCMDLEKLKAIELPPYELEHVELQLDIHKESPDHMAFVDAVLSCCSPESLTLRSPFPLTDFEEQSDVVKFTSEKLLQQEDQGDTTIQMVSSSSSKAQKEFWDFESLSMALPHEGNIITFIKDGVD